LTFSVMITVCYKPVYPHAGVLLCRCIGVELTTNIVDSTVARVKKRLNMTLVLEQWTTICFVCAWTPATYLHLR